MASRKTKREEALLKRIVQDYDWAKTERDTHTTDWADARNQYASEWVELQELEDDEDLDQWIYVPKSYAATHRIECEIQGHFFPASGEKLLAIKPAPCLPGSGAEALRTQVANIYDAILHLKLDLESQPRAACASAWNAALLEGTGPLKVEIEGGSDPEFRIVHVPNEHLVWDPYALSLDDITFFAQEIWLSDEELWQLHLDGVYENVKDILDHPDDAGDDDWRTDITGPGNSMRRLYKLVTYWGPQQAVAEERIASQHRRGKHTKAEDIIATVYQDKVLLRQEKNKTGELYENPTPYERLPFFLATALPKRGSTRGWSLTKIVYPLQREVNTLRNQRRQAVDMELAGKLLYDRNRQFDVKAYTKARYGGLVGVNGDPGTATHWLVPKTSTGNMGVEEQVIDSDIRDVTGVTHYHMGSTAQGMQKTATGVSILTEEGNVKMDAIIKNLAATSVVPIGRMLAAHLMKHLTRKQIQNILGMPDAPPEFDAAKFKDYQVEVYAGASKASKAAQLRDIGHATQVWGQLANAAPQVALPALLELAKRQMHLLGLSDVGDFEKNARQGMGPGPAAQQTPGMQSYAGMTQMAAQGRTPTLDETPRGR